MKCNLYAIYDRIAQCAMPPFTARNDDEALRMFDQGLQQQWERSPNAINPQDFQVLHVGYWSDSPCQIVAAEAPTNIAESHVFVPRKENA